MSSGSEAAQLDRVAEKLGALVLEFCRGRIGCCFWLGELEQTVRARAKAATPGSAGRILRELRSRRALGYTVVSRKDSQYRITWALSAVPPKLPPRKLHERAERAGQLDLDLGLG